MSEITKVPSEINEFFKEKRRNAAIFAFTRLLDDLRLNDKMLGGVNFCKRGKHESWKLLLTTDVKLDFLRAYEIYAMRWAIEVFFSDSKRLLGLADCSARDFSSQIAHVALVMIRYNLFAMIKRAHDYETIGALFSEIYMGVYEITVIDKIWAVIIEVIAIVAEMLGVDDETLMEQIIADNKRLAAMQAYAETA